jgi:hypothetical protein
MGDRGHRGEPLLRQPTTQLAARMKHSLRHVKTCSLGLALLAVTAAVAATAASAASAATCPPPPATSQVFKAWGDTNDYAAMPSGSFESTLSGWSSYGSGVVAGNEPWYVHSKSDSQAFALGSGGSFTTSAICEPLLQPVLRLFIKNIGTSTGRLHIEFLVTQNNKLYVLDGGYVTSGTGWTLTNPIVGSWSGPLSGALQIRITAVGSGAAFVVDDLYADPYLSR